MEAQGALYARRQFGDLARSQVRLAGAAEQRLALMPDSSARRPFALSEADLCCGAATTPFVPPIASKNWPPCHPQ